MIREYILQYLHILNIFFLFIFLKIMCVSLALEVPHCFLSAGVQNGLSLDCHSVLQAFKSLLQFMQFMQIYVSESEYHIRNMKTALQIAAFRTI